MVVVKNLRVNKLTIILTLALLIRLLLMPFTLHVDPVLGGDILAINKAAADFIISPAQSHSPYPPLALVLIGRYQSIWVGASQNPFMLPVGDLPEIISSTDIFKILFYSKLLYLLFDVLAVFLLFRFYHNDPDNQYRTVAFWVFNPLLIWNAYIHGQYDILPIVLLLGSLLLLKERRFKTGMLVLSLAAALKNFAFFFLIPFALIFGRNWKERTLLFIVGITPYLFILFLFPGTYLRSVGTNFEKFFLPGYDLGNGHVYFFIILYTMLTWFLYQRKAAAFDDAWQSGLIIMLLYYQFSPFDLHYWAWILPFALFFWITHPGKARQTFGMIFLGLLVLSLSTPLARFLAPLNPQFFINLPSPLELINAHLPMFFITNMAHSMVVGLSFYFAWEVFKRLPCNQKEPSKEIQ